MFDGNRAERDLAPLALVLWVLLLIVAGVAGWFMMNNLRQAQNALAQATQAQQAAEKKAAAEHNTAAVCTQQLTACKTESSTCSTALDAERAKTKQLESRGAPAGGRRHR